MDIVKKNILSIACGVVALIALIVPMWPMGGYQDELQKDLNAKKQVYTTLEGLERKTRMMPTLDPEAKEATPLTQFPSPRIIEAGKKATEAVATESKKMYAAAVEINQKGRTLLVAESLPKPRSPQQIAFREQYQRVFHDHLINEVLKGTTPPTPEEIKAEAARMWTEDFAPRIFRTVTGTSNEASIKAQHEEAVALLPEQMRRRRAENSKVYVEPGAFDVSKDIVAVAAGTLPEAKAIWWAQVGLWVQQDIAQAIANANAQAANVTEAPVKRLVRIEVPPRFVLPAGQGNAQQQPMNPWDQPTASPQAQPQDLDAPLPKAPAVSPTGRVSNPMFDVLHATLTVDVDAEAVPQFLAQLTNGRFFTVLKVDVITLDSATLRNNGYYFGNKPVVQLKLNLEALFMRAWTQQYMPDSVKMQLGIPLQPAGVAMQ